VTDAERLWKGDYQTCPHCGMLNEPGARTCYNCQNLLFSFDQKP
jgi:RNA polymerase-binding transcription factor DksA